MFFSHFQAGSGYEYSGIAGEAPEFVPYRYFLEFKPLPSCRQHESRAYQAGPRWLTTGGHSGSFQSSLCQARSHFDFEVFTGLAVGNRKRSPMSNLSHEAGFPRNFVLSMPHEKGDRKVYLLISQPSRVNR